MGQVGRVGDAGESHGDGHVRVCPRKAFRGCRHMWKPAVILLVMAGASLAVGRYSVLASLGIVSDSAVNSTLSSETAGTILWQIRLPRILSAMLIGAMLSAAGAGYQGVFRNPMVSPDVLGASAGAAVGAAIGIVMQWSFVAVQACAFAGGLIAVALAYAIGHRAGRGQNGTLALVLAGMVISAVFAAAISFVKYVADPYGTLPVITFWLMGGLSSATMSDVWKILLPAAVVGLVPIIALRWRVNTLAFGDDEAASLGVNPRAVRAAVVVSATVLTSAAVSVGGIIGWVGLLVPHLARMIVGPNYRLVIPASALLGGAFLLLMDDVARSAWAVEVPLGILTAWVGAPFFVWLMLRQARA